MLEKALSVVNFTQTDDSEFVEQSTQTTLGTSRIVPITSELKTASRSALMQTNVEVPSLDECLKFERRFQSVELKNRGHLTMEERKVTGHPVTLRMSPNELNHLKE